MALTAAVVGVGISAYGTIKSGQAADKQAKMQQKGLKSQQAAEEVKQARERRNAIREARIKRAAIVQSGANQGATNTSSVSGGAGSITSQMGSTVSFLDTVGGHYKDATGYAVRGVGYGATAQKYAGIASLGATIFDVAKGAAQDSIWGKDPATGKSKWDNWTA